MGSAPWDHIGMTNNGKRVWHHKNHILEGSTVDYNAIRLVCWESFDDVPNAIDREKKLKSWRRKKKLRWIANFNPAWKDLARGGFATHGPSASLGMTRDERVRNSFSH